MHHPCLSLTPSFKHGVMILGPSGPDMNRSAAFTNGDSVFPHGSNFQSFFDDQTDVEDQRAQLASPQSTNLPEAEPHILAPRFSDTLDDIPKAKQETQNHQDRPAESVSDSVAEAARPTPREEQETSANSVLHYGLNGRNEPDINPMDTLLQANTKRQTEDVGDAQSASDEPIAMLYGEGGNAHMTAPFNLITSSKVIQGKHPQTPDLAGSEPIEAKMLFDPVAHQLAQPDSALSAPQEVLHNIHASLPTHSHSQDRVTSQPQIGPEDRASVAWLDKTVPDQAFTFGHQPKVTAEYRSAGSFVAAQSSSVNVLFSQQEMKPLDSIRIDPKAEDSLSRSILELSKSAQVPMRSTDMVVSSPLAMPYTPNVPANVLAELANLPSQARLTALSDLSEGAEWSVGVMPSQTNMIGNGPAGLPPLNVARQLTQQFLPASFASPQGSVDIQLNPEALGRVRINMTMADGAMIMNIQAERLDTLDLMRRNIDQLAQEFRQIGYENISFSFGQNAKQDQDKETAILIENSEVIDNKTLQPSLPILGQGVTGLDIRV